MYMQLYGLQEGSVRHFLGQIRDITEGRKPQMWPFFFDAIAAFHPRPRLRNSGVGVEKPYTIVSHHTPPNLAWKDFSKDEVPTPEDPRLRWILRLMILETARHVLSGRDSRFNAVFCIWLPDQKLSEGAEEHVAFEMYRDRLFYSREPIPDDLALLETSAHRAYLGPSDVKAFVEHERRVGFLGKVAGRLPGDTYGRLVAQELLRMKPLFELIAVEEGAIFYCEDQT